MTFEKKDLLKLARLSRLALSDNDIKALECDLDRIINLVDLLREVDVEGIEPMSHSDDRSLTLRSDESKPTEGRKYVQSSAGYDEGLVKVPKIIE